MVYRLVAPVILGIDFLQQHNLVLNFAFSPVTIQPFKDETAEPVPGELQPVWIDATKARAKFCAASIVEEPGTDIIDKYAIPCFAIPQLMKCLRNAFNLIFNNLTL